MWQNLEYNVTFALKVCFFNGLWVKDGIFIEAVKVMREPIKEKGSFYELD